MSDTGGFETRVVVLAPTGRDGELIRSVLGKAEIASETCADVASLCRAIASGAGAVLLAEEVITGGMPDSLMACFAEQPPWSDLPILVLTEQGASSPAAHRAMADLGNVTLLERPIRVAALVSNVRFALRARQRQYQIRSHLSAVEEAAKTSARLAAIVESSDDAIVSKTLDGVITSWNSGAERLFEYSAEEAIGQPILLIIPPDKAEEEQWILRRLRQNIPVQNYETERLAKSGRRVDVSVSVSPLRDASGRVVGASKVARDIGARKRADAALKEADRRKDEFLATLAHELRNPLAPIRTSLHILELAKSNGAIDPALAPTLEIMDRQVDHIVRLVDDLLEVSRITRGKIEFRPETVELDSVIESAVETSRPLIDAARHELIVEIPRKNLTLEADPVRLSQVFANLLNNAAKYTEEGGTIWLTVSEENSHVRVAVRDTGVGIDAEMLPRIFEMFSQADNRPEGRAPEGLGIGLWLVQNLVAMHGGSVGARSGGIGMGSEFVVQLPRVAEARASAAEPPRARFVDESLSWLSVLVVDDNHDAADSLGALLRSLGAKVRIAYDGPSALKLVAEDLPGVALLDIGMPGMDGYEVARRIREEPQYRDVTLIALTGWGQEKDRLRAEQAGLDHHIGKPAKVAELQELMLSIRRDRAATE